MRRKRSSVLDTSATTMHSSLSNFCHEFPGVLDRGHTQPADPAPGGGPPATQVPALLSVPDRSRVRLDARAVADLGTLRDADLRQRSGVAGRWTRPASGIGAVTTRSPLS